MGKVIRFAIAIAMRQEEIFRVTWNDYAAKTKMLTMRDRNIPERRSAMISASHSRKCSGMIRSGSLKSRGRDLVIPDSELGDGVRSIVAPVRNVAAHDLTDAVFVDLAEPSRAGPRRRRRPQRRSRLFAAAVDLTIENHRSSRRQPSRRLCRAPAMTRRARSSGDQRVAIPCIGTSSAIGRSWGRLRR